MGHAVRADLVLVVDLDEQEQSHIHAYNRLASATATSSHARIWRISHIAANRMQWQT